MTERPTAMDWDDDRLDAAFAARDHLRPAADRLIAPTLELVAAARRPTAVHLLPAFRPALAVLAVAILIGGVAISGSRSNVALPTAGLTSQPSTAAATAASTASSVPTAGPETALGLPIISVSDAVAVRDGGVDNRELAVRGWFTPVDSAMFLCPLMYRQIPPVQMGCGDQYRWLTQDDDPVQRERNGATEFVPPKGPAIHPSFAQVGNAWWSSLPAFNPRACGRRASCGPVPPTTAPIEIIAIGHFDDRRASLCAANVRAECRDRFVVDRVDSVEGTQQALSVVENAGQPLAWTLDDIERLDPLGPGESRLSIGVGSDKDESATIEPGIANDRLRVPATWLIRDLIDGYAVTRIIADGSRQVDEILPDGSIRTLYPAPPPPDPSWPPAGSIVIPRSSADPPWRAVAVVDQSGHLIDAVLPTVEPFPTDDLSVPALWVDPDTRRRVILRWSGSLCDRYLVLTVRANGSLVLAGKRDGACRLALLTFAVELRFDEEVDSPAFVDQMVTVTTVY